MIYRAYTQLKILFIPIIILSAGFTTPLKAQNDTTVIEETEPTSVIVAPAPQDHQSGQKPAETVPIAEPAEPSSQDNSNRQTASDSIPDQSFTAPDYNTAKETYTVSEVPNPKGGKGTGYISDPNDYLSASDEYRINNIINKIDKTSTAQVAVVFVKSIGNEVPKQFAVDLFEAWGIGQAGKDNGLLILNVMDQRRTEIETGYGLEGALPDVICFRILNNEVVPNYRNGNYGAGMISSANRIETILRDPSIVDEIYDDSIGSSYEESTELGFWGWLILLYMIICVLIAIVYIIAMWVINRSKEDYYDKYKQLERFNRDGCLMILFPIPLVIFRSFVSNRLEKYRKAPRFSRENGKKMTLLNAWAENEFLETEQILEEKIKSIEYDVWATESEDDIMILQYEGENSRKYSKCKECGYKTFGRTKSKVIRPATYDQSGERKIHYKCKNCHYEEIKEEVIPQKTRSSSSSSSGGSSFSSSSGGSSSFGGGSSGGGGAGVSW
jgi:uncharacterized protein